MTENLPEPIPSFEGRPVSGVVFRVQGAAPLQDLEGVVLSHDDRVQLVSTYTVVGVDFKVDAKTGDIVRVQTLRPAEMHLIPFDENDPSDDGILRALPVVTGSVQGDDE